jgi:glycosyltransferase involved in cell wall biosynthesis
LPHRKTLPRFLTIAVFSLALNTLLMALLTSGTKLHYLAAQVFATGGMSDPQLSGQSILGLPGKHAMKQNTEPTQSNGRSYCLSVIVPAYNEQEVLPELYKRLTAVLSAHCPKYEIVFVNDGSRDRTLQVMRELKANDPHVGYINLSRNFGKETAMTAGLDAARGDAIVVIDADLQDPPEVIPQLVEGWREGFRRGLCPTDQPCWRNLVEEGDCGGVLQRDPADRTDQHSPRNVGDFRLLSRRAVDALKQLRERHRFMKGLVCMDRIPAESHRLSAGPPIRGGNEMELLETLELRHRRDHFVQYCPTESFDLFGLGGRRRRLSLRRLGHLQDACIW